MSTPESESAESFEDKDTETWVKEAAKQAAMEVLEESRDLVIDLEGA